jgi:hypothetical protein
MILHFVSLMGAIQWSPDNPLVKGVTIALITILLAGLVVIEIDRHYKNTCEQCDKARQKGETRATKSKIRKNLDADTIEKA